MLFPFYVIVAIRNMQLDGSRKGNLDTATISHLKKKIAGTSIQMSAQVLQFNPYKKTEIHSMQSLLKRLRL